MQNSQEKTQETTGLASTDYFLAAAIVVEAICLYFLLVSQAGFIGILIPIAVSIASLTITSLAVRDFFRQHK